MTASVTPSKFDRSLWTLPFYLNTDKATYAICAVETKAVLSKQYYPKKIITSRCWSTWKGITAAGSLDPSGRTT